ncbi:autotransporter domain-containing protein, partial [Ahrensia sp. R2A130]|uniref:autotransporter domain-containing protein n=1 Tax=Ahrensia sp. R2A130 TaxID=744979 RepID=UPI0001E0E036
PADTVSPTVTLATGAAIVNGPYVVTYTFSEQVSGFDNLNDIRVVNGTSSPPVAGVGNSFTSVITPANTGSVVVQVSANTVTDNASNGNIASSELTTSFIARGTVTLVVNSAGTDTSVNFVSATTSLNLNVVTRAETGLTVINDVDAGQHSITQTDLSENGIGTQAITCDDPNAVVNLSTRTVQFNLPDGGHLICTFDLLETRDTTGKIISNFLGARNGLILSHQPSRSRRIDRLRGGDGGPSTGTVSAFGFNVTNPVPFDAALNGNVISYSTSFNRLQKMHHAFNRLDDAFYKTSKWDFWAEGQFAFSDAAAESGEFAIAHFGLDYLLSPQALVGFSFQYDQTKFKDDVAQVNGQGWMIGPYGTIKLGQNFHFDARAAWGQSRNDINPFGTYTDTFDTSRWLISAALIGDFEVGYWNITPGLELSYISETQEAYSDSLNIGIPERTVSQGEVRIGPKFSRNFEFSEDKTISVFGSFEGVSAFGDGGQFTNGSIAAETLGITGSTRLGFDITSTGGAKISLSGGLGGIGSNANIYSGAVKLSIPLQ